MNNRRILLSILWVLLGIGLIVACALTELDEFWSGMGAALIVVGVLQIFRWARYVKDADYQEKMDVEAKDERNRFLAAKAWAWSGYLFVMISAVASIVLRIFGLDLISIVVSGGICTILVLYWVSYFILKRKY